MRHPVARPAFDGWLQAILASIETAIEADLDAEADLLRLDRELTAPPEAVPSGAVSSEAVPSGAAIGGSDVPWGESEAARIVDPDTELLVRPYTTIGRPLDSSARIAVEALVRATPRGDREAPTVGSRWRTIIGLCQQTLSVAELAAYGGVPIGVARGIVGEMAAAGLLDVHEPARLDDDFGRRVLERVLKGLQRL